MIRTESLGGSKPKNCPKCGGRGRQIKQACPRCDGFGRLCHEHLQEFVLPLGLRVGETYSLSSFDVETQSEAQIFVEFRVLRHPIFQIENYDLLCEYHIDFDQAPTERQWQLSTPLGSALLTVPPEAKSGDVVRIFGAGAYCNASKKSRGDLVVLLKKKKKSFWKRILRIS